MSSLVTNGKVLGILPVGQYTKITYILLLISSGVALISTFLAVVGIYLGLGLIGGVCGILALLFAVLGIALLATDLTSLDKNHLTYICVLFVAFYLLSFLFAAIGGLLALLLSLFFAVIQFGLVFTGFNSWSKGRMLSAQNIKSELNLAVKRS